VLLAGRKGKGWLFAQHTVVMSRRDHPAFAAFYAGLARAAERGSMARLRRKTLASARGRVLIVGAGQGHDLAHLPPAVVSVVALEPDSAMRRWGAERVRRSAVPASYVAGTAEHVPLRDHSVDTVLCTLVLCSVDDLDAAVAEIRRVLAPGGRLLVLEHVRAQSRPRLAAVQDWADPFWGKFSGGCHLNRDPVAALDRAGFDTSGLADRHLARFMPLLDPAVLGVAHPSGPIGE
jgi:ubiquinone/menaquinone biosynthesis C-methylase UbiE